MTHQSTHLRIIYPTLIIFVSCLLLFSIIYSFTENFNATDSFYSAVMIQTLVGVAENPQNNSTKWLMSLQAIISYIITAGIIVFAFKRYFPHHKTSHS